MLRRLRYQKIKEKELMQHKKYYALNKEKIQIKNAEYKNNHIKELSEWLNGYYFNNKLEAFNKYGGPVCACCGETHFDSLTIDHLNNDGHAHKRKSGSKISGRALYNWLKKNNYPFGYQVLCFNCNYLKHILGHIPYYRINICSGNNINESDMLQERYGGKSIHYMRNNFRYKLDVINAYGTHQCSWCDEKDFNSLSIDHIDNDGAAHRKLIFKNNKNNKNNAKLPSGLGFYLWLKRNNYPPGFKILCLNCNCVKSLNAGELPLDRKNKYIKGVINV